MSELERAEKRLSAYCGKRPPNRKGFVGDIRLVLEELARLQKFQNDVGAYLAIHNVFGYSVIRSTDEIKS